MQRAKFVIQVKQKTLIIWGEDDQIISNKLAVVSNSNFCSIRASQYYHKVAVGHD